MSSDNIEVVVRVRPLLPREEGEKVHWKVSGDQKNSLTQTTAADKGSATYAFDRVYDTSKDNAAVFNDIVKPIVAGALNGINGTVFAYGQTSSGKTHTMMGTKNNPGIIPLTIKSIFQGIEDTPDRQYLISMLSDEDCSYRPELLAFRASYMEIYNESISDLLVTRGSVVQGSKSLTVREDNSGNIYVADLKEEDITDEAKLLSIMFEGDRNRQVGCTNMNDRSSRSHTIFRIVMESQCAVDEDSSLDGGGDDVAVTVSHLNLVDLAGSENAAQTGATGDRLREGGYINKSLFMLGRVISQLSEGEAFVNFRDSKLTRILQCSLGGNARTAIICTVTPVAVEQTHSTLRFASRAKNIKNKPVVNEVLTDTALFKRYNKEIKQLKTALEQERHANRADEVMQVKEELNKVEQMNEELQRKLRELHEKLVTSSVSRTPKPLKKSKLSRRETWAAPAVKGRATLLPLDLASLNIRFQTPFGEAQEDFSANSRRCGLPRICETESLSECSFTTAAEEFCEFDSTVLKRLDQSLMSRLDSSAISNTSPDEVFTAHSKPKVSFASPSSLATADDVFPHMGCITKRKRRSKNLVSVSSKQHVDAQCQTDTSLMPKPVLLASPRTPRRTSPSIHQPSSCSPLGETPRQALRARISQLNDALSEKDGHVSDLRCELLELQELHDFAEADYRFREESLLAKIEDEPADVKIKELQRELSSLRRSLHDSELLLLDANKRASEQTQEIHCQRLEAEHLREENERLAKDLKEQSTFREQCAGLTADNERLKRDLKAKHDSLNLLEKDRQDYDMILQLTVEKHELLEKDLRKSLEVAWADLAKYESGATVSVSSTLTATTLQLQLEEQMERLSALKLEKNAAETRLEKVMVSEQQLLVTLAEKERELKLLKSELEKLTPKDEHLFAVADVPVHATQCKGAARCSETPAVCSGLDDSTLSTSYREDVEMFRVKCEELERLLQLQRGREVELTNKMKQMEEQAEMANIKQMHKSQEHECAIKLKQEKEDKLLQLVEVLKLEIGTLTKPKDEVELCSSVTEWNEKVNHRYACIKCEKFREKINIMDLQIQKVVAGDSADFRQSREVVSYDKEEIYEESVLGKEVSEMIVAKPVLEDEVQTLIQETSAANQLTSDAHSSSVSKEHCESISDLHDSINVSRATLQPSVESVDSTAQECNNSLSIENSQRFAELLKINSELRAELNQVEGKGAAACIQCEELQSHINVTLGSNVSVSKQLDKAVTAKVSLEEEFASVKEKISSSNAESLEKTSMVEISPMVSVALLQKRLKGLSIKLKAFESSDTDSRVIIDELNSIIMELEAKYSEAVSTFMFSEKDAEYESIIDGLKMRCSELELELSEVSEKLSGCIENEAKQCIISDEFSKILSPRGVDNVNLQSKLEQLKAKIFEMEKEREGEEYSLEERIALSGKFPEVASEQSMCSEDTVCEDVSKKTDFLEVSGDVQVKYNELEQTVAMLRLENNQMKVEISALSENKEEHIEKLTNEIESLKLENIKLCSEIEDIESLNLDHMSIKQEIEDLSGEVQSLRESKNLLLQQIKEESEGIERDREEQFKKLTRDLEIISNENAELKKTISILTTEKLERESYLQLRTSDESNDTEIDEMTNVQIIESLKMSNKELMMEIEELKALNCREEYESCINDLNEQISVLHLSKQQLKDELQAVQHEKLEAIKECALKRDADDFRNLELQRDALLMNIQRMKLDQVNHSNDNVILELTEQICTLKEEKISLMKKIEDMKLLSLQALNDCKNEDKDAVFNDTNQQSKIPASLSSEGTEALIRSTSLNSHEPSCAYEALIQDDNSPSSNEVSGPAEDTFDHFKQIREVYSSQVEVLSNQVDDLKQQLTRVQSEFSELSVQKQELLLELQLMSGKRKASQRRRVSSVSTVRDESCLQPEDFASPSYGAADESTTQGRTTTTAVSLCNLSHRLLHSLTLLEESVVFAGDRTELNATVAENRTFVLGEELSMTQLTSMKDELLMLQRTLLAASLNEYEDFTMLDYHCSVYAENEVAYHTWKLLESFSSDFLLLGSDFPRGSREANVPASPAASTIRTAPVDTDTSLTASPPPTAPCDSPLVDTMTVTDCDITLSVIAEHEDCWSPLKRGCDVDVLCFADEIKMASAINNSQMINETKNAASSSSLCVAHEDELGSGTFVTDQIYVDKTSKAKDLNLDKEFTRLTSGVQRGLVPMSPKPELLLAAKSLAINEDEREVDGVKMSEKLAGLVEELNFVKLDLEDKVKAIAINERLLQEKSLQIKSLQEMLDEYEEQIKMVHNNDKTISKDIHESSSSRMGNEVSDAPGAIELDQSIGSADMSLKSKSDKVTNMIQKDSVTATSELLEEICLQKAKYDDLHRKLQEANLVAEEAHCLRWRGNDLDERNKDLQAHIRKLEAILPAEHCLTNLDECVSGIGTSDSFELCNQLTDNHTAAASRKSDSSISNVEEAFEDILVKLDDKESKLEKMESQVTSLEGVIMLKSSPLSDCSSEQQILRLVTEKQKMCLEISRLKSVMEISEEERDNWEENLGRVTEQYENSKYECDILKQDILNLKEEIAVNAAMLESITAKYNDLKASAEGKVELEAIKVSSTSVGDELKLRADIERLAILLKEKESSSEEYLMKIKYLTAQLKERETHSEEHLMRIEALTLLLKEKESTSEEYIAKIESLTLLLKEKESMSEEYLLKIKDLTFLLEEKVTSSEEHLIKIKDLTSHAENIELKLKNVSEETTQMTDRLLQSLAAKEEELKKMKEHVDKLELIVDELRSESREEDKLLQNELAVKVDNCSILSLQLAKTKEEFTSLSDSYDRIKMLFHQCSDKLESITPVEVLLGREKLEDIFDCFVNKLDWLIDSFVAQKEESKQSAVSLLNLQQIVDRKIEEIKLNKDEHENEVQKLVNILEMKVQEKEEAIRDLEQSRLASEEQLRYQLKLKVDQLKQLEEAAGDLEQELKVKENCIENLRVQIGDEETRISQMKQKIASLQSRLDEVENSNECKRVELEKLSAELSAGKVLTVQINNFRQERDEALLTIDKLEIKVSESLRRCEQLESEIIISKEKAAHLDIQLQSALQLIQRRDAEKQRLQDDVKRLDSDVEKYQLELSEKDGKASLIDADHFECKKSISERDAKLNALETVHMLCQERIAEKESKLSGIQNEHEMCHRIISDKDVKLARLQQELSKSEAKLRGFYAEVEIKCQCKNEMQVLKQKLLEQEQATNIFTKECDEYLRQNEKLRQDVINLEKEKLVFDENLKKQQLEFEINVRVLREEVQKYQDEVEKLLSATQCTAELYELWNTHDRDLHVNNLVTLHEQTGATVTRKQDFSDSLKEMASLKEQLLEKENKNKQLDLELNDLVDHYEKRISGHIADLKDMPARILELWNANEVYKEQIARLEKKITRLQQSVGLFQGENYELEKSLLESMDKLRRLDTPQQSVASLTKEDPVNSELKKNIEHLQDELASCKAKLKETEAERKRLDSELDDTVQHYKSRIAFYVDQLEKLPEQAAHLDEDKRALTAERTHLATQVERLKLSLEVKQKQNQEMQQAVLETMDKLHRKEEEDSSKNNHSAATGDDSGVLSDSQQRQARHQRLAHLDILSLKDKEIVELKERVEFAETKMHHYLGELRRMQSSASLNSTVYQLQGHGWGGSKKPPTQPLQTHSTGDSSREVVAREAEDDSPKLHFEGGSHIVMSVQVSDMRRQLYLLEKDNKELKGEINSVTQHLNHYKTKAQEWKTSSLLHQKHTAKLKAELCVLHGEINKLKAQVKVPKISHSSGDHVLNANESSSAQNSLELPSRGMQNPSSSVITTAGLLSSSMSSTRDTSSHKVLKEFNRLRNAQLDLDELHTKQVKTAENVPPQIECLTTEFSNAANTSQHTNPIRFNTALITNVMNAGDCDSIISASSAVGTDATSNNLSASSSDTFAAPKITGFSSDVARPYGDVGSGGTRDTVATTAASGSGRHSVRSLLRHREDRKNDTDKYLLPYEPKKKDECKTQ